VCRRHHLYTTGQNVGLDGVTRFGSIASSSKEPAMTDYRARSMWLDGIPGELTPRPSLSGPTDVDVAIVGAGFTGLWTAYYLKKADPHLRVAVLEREIAILPENHNKHK
jgi:hypothetical protein